MGLIKITPDEEKANSMLKMAVITLKMIETIDKTKFPSNIVKEYYDVIRELMSSILLLDGYKLIGENAHKNLIDYIKSKYDLEGHEISLLDELRIIRNKIAYDGFFVTGDYVERKEETIKDIILKLELIVNMKLDDDEDFYRFQQEKMKELWDNEQDDVWDD